MNKKGYVGLVAGLVKLFGGMVFIYLLITFFGGGFSLSALGSNGLVMLLIVLAVLFILVRKK